MYSLIKTLHCHHYAPSLLVCKEGGKSGMFGEKEMAMQVGRFVNN